MKLDDLPWRTLSAHLTVAHVQDFQIWKIRNVKTDVVTYTIARRADPSENEWFNVDALVAQCVLYDLLGNPEGNK